MSDAVFLSQSSLFEGDYHCILHNPKNEFTSVLHYHDFYEVVIYLGNAGVFQIEGSEYLVRRGDHCPDRHVQASHLNCQQKQLLRTIQC